MIPTSGANVFSEPQTAAAVFFLTKEPVFGLDVVQAFSDVGLQVVSPLRHGAEVSAGSARFMAVIIDADGLDDPDMATVRQHAADQVPLVLIADGDAVDRTLQITVRARFSKPLAMETLVACVLDLLGCAARPRVVPAAE